MIATIDPDTWAYHDDFAQVLQSKDRNISLRLLEAADLALTFARALVSKDYERANGMLSADLKSSCPPDVLQQNLERMIQFTGDVTEWPTVVQVVTGTDKSDMGKWVRKAPEDFAWIYISIIGEGYCEAVAPTIAEEGQRLTIRDIDWGRP